MVLLSFDSSDTLRSWSSQCLGKGLFWTLHFSLICSSGNISACSFTDVPLLIAKYFLEDLRLKEENVGKHELMKRHPFAILHQNSLD